MPSMIVTLQLHCLMINSKMSDESSASLVAQQLLSCCINKQTNSNSDCWPLLTSGHSASIGHRNSAACTPTLATWTLDSLYGVRLEVMGQSLNLLNVTFLGASWRKKTKMIWMLFVNIVRERTMNKTMQNQLIRTLLCSSFNCVPSTPVRPFQLVSFVSETLLLEI